MADFEISYLADQDLTDIARYAVEQWGVDQAVRYMNHFDKHFTAIAKGEVLTKQFIRSRHDLQISRCQKYVVFHFMKDGEKLLILAVFHEQMDLMQRLLERLDESS